MSDFTIEDFAERHEALKDKMLRNGIDVLLMAGGSNLLYFTSFKHRPHDRLIVIGLPKEGEAFIFCPKFEYESIEEKILYGNKQIFTWAEYENPFEKFGQILNDKKYSNIAIDEHFPYWQFDSIAKASRGVKFSSGEHMCKLLRSIKSVKEQDCMRKASQNSLNVHEKAFSTLYEGMKMSELEAIYAKLHTELGMTDVWGGGSFGHGSSFIHGTIQDIALEQGMVILADAGARYSEYFSDISRTIVFGEVNQEVQSAWTIAKECQIAGMEALKPGEPCETVDLAIRNVLEKNNYSPTYKYLPHRVGHGLGLDIHEWPYLVEGSKDIIKPGMVFAFDGAFYIEGKFGIRLEDNYLITQDGFEVFGNRQATAIDRPFGLQIEQG